MIMNKERFLKVYANLPINLRNDVIYVSEEYGPITWNAAYIEINNETNLGRKIFDKLVEMKII